jgi:pSer/pThr/pTyr-binding forkhead associated (FHA) protein
VGSTGWRASGSSLVVTRRGAAPAEPRPGLAGWQTAEPAAKLSDAMQTLGAKPTTPVELKAQIQAERDGAAFLVHRDGDGEQRILSLAGGTPVWVGRRDSVELCLSWDPQVSSVHAELQPSGGAWTLVDDGLSRNGSFVNGERVNGRRRLRDRDVLRFGTTVVLFRAPAEAGGAAQSTVLAGGALVAADLSETQRKVLIALCRPFKDGAAVATPTPNQQIADELFLSVQAVKAHLRVLFEKFGVEDLAQNSKRAALVQRALGSGLISNRDLAQ